MIRLYFTRFESGGEEFLPLLSEQRREKADGIKAAGVRRQTIFSYVLLRLALSENYGISAAPEFVYGEHGKPFLKDFPDIHFSLSHAADAALCALSDEPVGADIQDIRRLKLSAARKFCTPEEIEGLSSVSDTDRELCRLWCIKESYGKLTGKGFSGGFDGIDTEELLKSGKTVLFEREGFFIAVSSESCTGAPGITEVTGAELLCGIEKGELNGFG